MTTRLCVECQGAMNWSEQRRQFGRLCRSRLVEADAAKTLMPRCQKCTTEMLERLRLGQPPATLATLA